MTTRLDLSPRAARLQAIRDRWFSEPLKAHFPPLGDDPSSHPLPANSHELISGTRLATAFSSLHKTPDIAGMSYEDALAHDRDMNFRRFRVEDPKALLRDLSLQFTLAPGGQVEPQTLKKGYVLLETLKASSLELIDQLGIAASPAGKESDLLPRASYLADAEAISQAQVLVKELAAELGMSLPANHGADRGR